MKTKLKSAIKLLRRGTEYQSYFFKKLRRLDLFFDLKKEDFFSYKYNSSPIPSKENQNLFTIPYWPALTYLEKVSEEAAKLQNEKYAKALMDILRDVTMPEGNPENRSDNYRTWHIFAKIMGNLPNSIIKREDIDLIEYWLDSQFGNSLVGHEIARNLLPKFLKSGVSDDLKKAERIVEIATRPKDKGKTLMGVYELAELFKKNAEFLGRQCCAEIISILKDRLEDDNILSEKDDKYGYIWRSAIEEHKQNTSEHEPRYILISGLRDVLLAYSQAKNNKKILNELWRSSRFMIRRIVIFIRNQRFNKKTCGKFLRDNMPDVFLESNYYHETFELIRARFPQFSKKTQDEIIEVIDNLTREWREDIPQEEKDELNMSIRRRWFYAVKLSGYKLPGGLENKYSLSEYKLKHPEFLSYHSVLSYKPEQLFSVADLMKNPSVEAIVAFLNEFKGKNRFNEIGYEEAGQVLKQAVKANQLMFEKDLQEFKKAKPVYQYYVLEAFEEIWNSKNAVGWPRVLEFFKVVLGSKELWKKEDEKRTIGFYFRKDWIPSLAARFIQAGVYKDDWAMPDECLKDARTILEDLLTKVEPTAKGNESDALTEAINSTKGHVIEAYIDLSLRKCRILTKYPEDKGVKQRREFWEEIKHVFDQELEKSKNANFEFSALAGRYLPNLYYLSEEWTKNNINCIFPKDKRYERNWRCAMAGYSYVNTVYTVIYNLLKENGHLKRVLDTSFDNHMIRERIIDNIAISYVRGQETLKGEGSLFAEILRRWESQDVCDVVGLFWAHREAGLKDDEVQKIRNFWQYCFDKIQGKESSCQDILSDLNLLAVFLSEIDFQAKQWLMQSAPYVDHHHHSYFFLESLDRLADTNPKDVAEIYVGMVNHDVVPRYKEENIYSIVKKIYKAGEKTLANQICDSYKRRGDDFLSDLYDKYNK